MYFKARWQFYKIYAARTKKSYEDAKNRIKESGVNLNALKCIVRFND